GHKPVVAWSVFGAGLTPLFWFWLTPRNWEMMVFEAALSGFFWPGFIAQSYTLAVANAPVEGRSMYLAVAAACGGLAALVGGACGGVIVETLEGMRVPFGPAEAEYALVPYHVNFFLTMVFRLASLLLLRRFREPGAMGSIRALRVFLTPLHRPGRGAGA
ncbi:MAG TPA: hypothetical protein VEI97_15500, partial [bacterium]|nr:hypothetical protein [bacterium]